MKFLIIFVSVLALALGHTLDAQWHAWKSMHGKTYRDLREEMTRHRVWLENLARIAEHNGEEQNFTLSLNQFADMVRPDSVNNLSCMQHA